MLKDLIANLLLCVLGGAALFAIILIGDALVHLVRLP